MDGLSIRSTFSGPRRRTGAPVHPEAAGDEFSAEVLESACAIAGEWASLGERSAAPAFYQGADWCMAWMDSCARSGHRERARIVTVRESGRLVLVWPLSHRTFGPVRILGSLGAPATQYSDILVDARSTAPAAFRAACRAVEDLGDADMVLMRGTRGDSTLAHLRGQGTTDWRVIAEERAPVLRLTGAADPRSLRTGRSLNALARHARLLAKAGPLRYERVEGAAQAAAVAEALALKDEWLRERGVTSAGYLHPANALLLSELARRSGFAVFRLAVGERTAAIEIGLLEKGRYLSMLQSYDQRFAMHAPGRLLLLRIFQDEASGIGFFDFMPPEMPHKTEWTGEAVPVADLAWPLTRRGRMATAYLRRGRPPMVRAFKSLPPGLRQRIARLPFVINA